MAKLATSKSWRKAPKLYVGRIASAATSYQHAARATLLVQLGPQRFELKPTAMLDMDQANTTKALTKA